MGVSSGFWTKYTSLGKDCHAFFGHLAVQNILTVCVLLTKSLQKNMAFLPQQDVQFSSHHDKKQIWILSPISIPMIKYEQNAHLLQWLTHPLLYTHGHVHHPHQWIIKILDTRIQFKFQHSPPTHPPCNHPPPLQHFNPPPTRWTGFQKKN